MTQTSDLPARGAQGLRGGRCRHRLRRAGARAAAGGGAAQRRADRGGQEGRQGLLLHRDGPRFRATPRQGVRGRSIRHRDARSSAPAPSACSSASARSMAPRSSRSTSPTPPTPRMSSSGSATAGSRPICRRRSRKHYRQGLLRRRWACDRDPHPGVADRLQHRAGEERRRAEELQGPARPEMGRQDGQGRIRPIAAPS